MGEAIRGWLRGLSGGVLSRVQTGVEEVEEDTSKDHYGPEEGKRRILSA